jgi:hypothetical protein
VILRAVRPVVCALALALIGASCSLPRQIAGSRWSPPASVPLAAYVPPVSRAPAPETIIGLQAVARVTDGKLVLSTKGRAVGFVTGVDVGGTLPGRFPSEYPIGAADWQRWLPMIADLGVHAIRLLDLQPPVFYDELLTYDTSHPDAPLYLVQGTGFPDDRFDATANLYDAGLRENMRARIETAVAAVHGDAVVTPAPGRPDGNYRADVSPWLAAWTIGSDLDPTLVKSSDGANPGAVYVGTYVAAVADASPTEAWFAEMLDLLADREAHRGRTMPIAFVDTPLLDPLAHSGAASDEDLVTVDPNHVLSTASWPGGVFAGYQLYPYYPDFLQTDPALAGATYGGQTDRFAGYVTALRAYHAAAGLPVVALETGLSSSIGRAHDGSGGRAQGGMTEQQVTAGDAGLLTMQRDLGLAGSFLFEWTDEWFKPTWNRRDDQRPADRRALWQDPLSAAAYSGLLAVEPGAGGPSIVVDGRSDDWDSDTGVWGAHADNGPVSSVHAAHDESYMYLQLALRQPEPWLAGPLEIDFSLLTDSTVDVRLVIASDGTAIMAKRGGIDADAVRYGLLLGYEPVTRTDVASDGGTWFAERLLIGRPASDPASAAWFDLGLVRGTTDYRDPAFDSRTTWAASAGMIELRLPWAMLGLADPSSRQALTLDKSLAATTTPVAHLGIRVVSGASTVAGTYTWDAWNRVEWHERPKAGLDGLARTIQGLSDS